MGALPPALPAIRHSTSITSVAPMSWVNLCLHFKWVMRTSPRMDMRTVSKHKSWLSLSTGSYLQEKWLSNNCIWSAWAVSCNATTSHGWGTLANPTNENRQPWKTNKPQTTPKQQRTRRKANKQKQQKTGRQTARRAPPAAPSQWGTVLETLSERVVHPARIQIRGFPE